MIIIMLNNGLSNDIFLSIHLIYSCPRNSVYFGYTQTILRKLVFDHCFGHFSISFGFQLIVRLFLESEFTELNEFTELRK